MRAQSWIDDTDMLQQFESQASVEGLDALKTRDDLIRVKSGRTRDVALQTDEDFNVYINFKARDENNKPIHYITYNNPYKAQSKTWAQAEDFYQLQFAKNYVKRMLPRKTGNLQDNALKVFMNPGSGGPGLTIDYSVAPYAQYPNVKRIIDRQWPSMTALFYQRLEKIAASRKTGLFGNTSDFKKVKDGELYGGYRDKQGRIAKVDGVWDYYDFTTLKSRGL